MRIAIDVDGTITKNPSLYKELMITLRKNNHTVFILTGNARNKVPRVKRLNQLKNIDIVNCYDELLIAEGNSTKDVGIQKGKMCKEYNIDLFIDNTEWYLEQVKLQSPGTLLLKAI